LIPIETKILGRKVTLIKKGDIGSAYEVTVKDTDLTFSHISFDEALSGITEKIKALDEA